jgi:hypothetical protein
MTADAIAWLEKQAGLAATGYEPDAEAIAWLEKDYDADLAEYCAVDFCWQLVDGDEYQAVSNFVPANRTEFGLEIVYTPGGVTTRTNDSSVQAVQPMFQLKSLDDSGPSMLWTDKHCPHCGAFYSTWRCWWCEEDLRTPEEIEQERKEQEAVARAFELEGQRDRVRQAAARWSFRPLPSAGFDLGAASHEFRGTLRAAELGVGWSPSPDHPDRYTYRPRSTP